VIISFGPASANLNTFRVVKDGNNCSHVVHDFSPLLHKQRYRVGVYSNLGDEWAKEMYGPVFADYLSATAGQHFNPPVTFEVVPVSMGSAIAMAQNGDIDFLFASSAVFSCMTVQFSAQALVTIINRRESRGYEYDLDVYGGVMFTLKDREDINDVEDFKGRTIGAGDIVSTGGGQTQFYEMYRHGLSYVADPKQVVFTKDERRVVQGVLDGEFEVGFAGTGMIEQHLTPDGKSVEDGTFKIINPQTHVLDNGMIFPFMASTDLHPEWPFSAMDKTDQYVTKEVQEALLALLDHAVSVQAKENLRCDTTPELAQLALSAQQAGSFTGFRTARSYSPIRTQQEAAGFLYPIKGKDTFECVGTATLYDDIQCPTEYYKVNQVDFQTSCADRGMECSEGYECFCSPCIKAFEVDVYQYTGEQSEDNVKGCDKMSLCGTTQQTKRVTFRMTDRLERVDPEIKVIMHWADLDKKLEVQKIDGSSFTYDFFWEFGEMGVAIMEISFDGEQIPESPMRLQIVARKCEEDYPGRGMVPNERGQCVCGANTSSIGDKCVPSSDLAVILSLLAVFLLAVAGAFYMQYRYQKGDEVWKVDVDELHFDQPPEIIGQGSFGVVLKAVSRHCQGRSKSRSCFSFFFS
jgi:ABC-type phosphate/phosphonate transport system substrate-binding protein